MARAPVAAALLALFIASCRGGPPYFGKEVGPLSELHHGVRGRVFAVDSRTLYLHDFHYDGEGPAAYFYVGATKAPGASGAVRLRDERGGAGPLRRYRGEGLTLALPDGHTLRDVRWFSVWCDEYAVNFGDVSIPRELEYPRSVKVGGLRGVHGVASDPVVVVDAQTLLVPNFSYDGEAPDAKFWVGRGDTPSPQGIRIPDEHGKETPLRRYDRKTIVLTLPGELTVFDIGHFAVWCEAFTVNFGHVVLPRSQLSNIPPSLKMLGVSPQNRNKDLVKEKQQSARRRPSARRPIARLDATTYRPQLKPGTGPLSAGGDSPAHTSLHRRADDYTPPNTQLIPTEKSEKQKHKSNQNHEYQLQTAQNQKQTVNQDDVTQTQQNQHTLTQQSEYQEPQIVQTLQAQNAQNQKHQNHEQAQTVTHNPYYQQERSQEIYTEHYQEPEYQYQNRQQHQNQFYQTPIYQNPFYQGQFFDQRAYEQRAFELLNHRQYQPQPLQYRLIPYNTGF